MKRFALAVLLMGLAFVAVQQIGELTETRPDHVPRNSHTVVVFEVDTRKYAPGVDQAAANLWAACAHLTWSRLANDGPVAVGNHRYEVVVRPGMGPYAQRKIVGCLEDLTIDRVAADVESVTLVTTPFRPEASLPRG